MCKTETSRLGENDHKSKVGRIKVGMPVRPQSGEEEEMMGFMNLECIEEVHL